MNDKNMMIQYALTFLMALSAAFNIGSSITKRKKLGVLVRRTMSALRFADKSQLMLAGGASALSISTMVFMELPEDKKLFSVLLLGVVLIYFMAGVLNILVTPGFYENGISTGSGILIYSEVKRYTQGHYAKDPTLKVFYLNPGRSDKSAMRLVVHEDEEKEIRAILKKKCSFK